MNSKTIIVACLSVLGVACGGRPDLDDGPDWNPPVVAPAVPDAGDAAVVEPEADADAAVADARVCRTTYGCYIGNDGYLYWTLTEGCRTTATRCDKVANPACLACTTVCDFGDSGVPSAPLACTPGDQCVVNGSTGVCR